MPSKKTEPILASFEDVASALERHATNRTLVTYNDFAQKVGLAPVNNLFSNSALKLFFDQIDDEDANEHRPLRTAVVVQKGTGRPGSGFYRSLESLRGIKITKSQEESIWSKEIADLHSYYAPDKLKPRLEIELSFAQQLRLEALASRYGRAPAALIERMLTSHLVYLESEISILEESITQADRGETHSHEHVMAMMKTLLRRKKDKS